MQLFDFTAALPERTGSSNTQRAYYRWVDRYLVDKAGLKPTHGEARLKRMGRLPLKSLEKHLSAKKLSEWLNTLATEGHGRQSLDQARAAIVTLAELMANDEIISTQLAAQIRAVSVPPIAKKQVPERLLTPDQLKDIMQAARDIATSENQLARNAVVATVLCTMALRREELSAARWGDLSLIDSQVVLNIDGSTVPVPRNVLSLVDRWRTAITTSGRDPLPTSPIVRRIWKGGRIARNGLSADGIWLIIRDAARHAGQGHVTPDDLRRSAVAGMWESGVPIEDISQLLRHRSVLITERFIARLGLG